MRVGEICGLQWQDFNFKQGSLSVTKTVERISLGNGKTKVVVEPPKTESSIRKVYMPPFITALLNDHKDTPEKYVLTGKLKPSEPRALQYKFKRILGKTNIRDMSFHSLRHLNTTKTHLLNFMNINTYISLQNKEAALISHGATSLLF